MGIDSASEARERYPSAPDPEKSYSDYYERSKDIGLLATLQATSETVYGKERGLPNSYSPLNYGEFRVQVPILESSSIEQNPHNFIRSSIGDQDLGELKKIISAGSSGFGAHETYYNPKKLKPQLPQHIVDALNRSTSPILLHDGSKYAVSYDLIEDALAKVAPNVKTKTYRNINEGVDAMRTSDCIYISEQVSQFRKFINQLDQLSQENPEITQALKNKQVFIELVAEPVYLDEIKRWFESLSRVFQTAPDLEVLYGLSETSGIVGVYAHDPKDEKIKYKILDGSFVEVLDSEGRPVIGQMGDVIVTKYRQEGSIYPRYKTGDRAVLEFDDGIPFLSEIGRDASRGTIDIEGYKISASSLYNALNGLVTSTNKVNPFEKFRYPTDMQFVLASIGDRKILKINLSAPQFDDPNNAEQAIECVRNFFREEYYHLNHFIGSGRLEININTSTISPESMVKGWQIMRQEGPIQETNNTN